MSTLLNPIRILAVDDHAIFRQGIIGLLADQPDMMLVAEASNGREAIQRYRAQCPADDLYCTSYRFVAAASSAYPAPYHRRGVAVFCLHQTVKLLVGPASEAWRQIPVGRHPACQGGGDLIAPSSPEPIHLPCWLKQQCSSSEERVDGTGCLQ